MSKIHEVLNDDKSVLVFDVDGVLAVLEWGEYNHFGEDDETWAKMHKAGQYLYTSQYVVKKMQDFLKDKNKDNVYVISKVFTDFELEDKKHYVNEFYDIDKDHVFAVRNNDEKAMILNKIKALHPDVSNHNIVMIDDTPDVLTYIMEHTKYSTAHISSFLDM